MWCIGGLDSKKSTTFKFCKHCISEKAICCDSPEGVGGEEWDVEGLFLGVALQRDEHGVAEPHVGQQLQPHQAIPGRAVVRVQNLTRVKELQVREKRLSDGKYWFLMSIFLS